MKSFFRFLWRNKLYTAIELLWIYLAVALVMTATAMAAISWQAVRLMNTDPVDALKTE